MRLTVDKFVCEWANDAAGGVDMDRFRVKAWAYQRPSEFEAEVPIVEDQVVYSWSTPGEHEMWANSEWHCAEPNTIDFVFDTENYDFDFARIHLWGYSREYDVTSANDHGYGEVDYWGDRFFDDGGIHSFLVDGPDHRFRVYVTIEALN